MTATTSTLRSPIQFKSRPLYADKIVYANRLATTYLALNENVEPLNDVNVRKAIQMAIDRQGILDAIYGGEGVTVDGIYPAGSIGFTEANQGWLQYDPEGAKALLEEAGYADGFDLELSHDASASASIECTADHRREPAGGRHQCHHRAL